ncbi:hypothetical protein C8Q80DRAFT_176706 [Daedaleopsis nitida]|nr:hypothetical protein C8Q80DRAFT_176706 [Daedaleopsis nitida]
MDDLHSPGTRVAITAHLIGSAQICRARDDCPSREDDRCYMQHDAANVSNVVRLSALRLQASPSTSVILLADYSQHSLQIPSSRARTPPVRHPTVAHSTVPRPAHGVLPATLSCTHSHEGPFSCTGFYSAVPPPTSVRDDPHRCDGATAHTVVLRDGVGPVPRRSLRPLVCIPVPVHVHVHV